MGGFWRNFDVALGGITFLYCIYDEINQGNMPGWSSGYTWVPDLHCVIVEVIYHTFWFLIFCLLRIQDVSYHILHETPRSRTPMDAVAATAPLCYSSNWYDLPIRASYGSNSIIALQLAISGNGYRALPIKPAWWEGPQRITTWARPCRFYGSHAVTLARSYRIGKISALKDLDHEVAINDLSEVCIRLHY